MRIPLGATAASCKYMRPDFRIEADEARGLVIASWTEREPEQKAIVRVIRGLERDDRMKLIEECYDLIAAVERANAPVASPCPHCGRS